MGIVYVLSNPAFDNYVKVGRTIDLEQRMKVLDNTSVPLLFRCVFAIEVDAQRVIAALKLTNGRDVTPKEDIAEDEESIVALERTVAKRKSNSFDDARVSIDDTLAYTKDENITAVVVGDKKIEFEGEVMSVSKAALILLHKEGYKWKQANGWAYWMKDGETLRERVERFDVESAEDDD